MFVLPGIDGDVGERNLDAIGVEGVLEPAQVLARAVDELFTEVLIGPGYGADVLDFLRKKKNRRVIRFNQDAIVRDKSSATGAGMSASADTSPEAAGAKGGQDLVYAAIHQGEGGDPHPAGAVDRQVGLEVRPAIRGGRAHRPARRPAAPAGLWKTLIDIIERRRGKPV